MPKPPQLSSCDVGLNGLDAESLEQGARPDVVAALYVFFTSLLMFDGQSDS
jgi:hypothetical protein